ncbi:MAG: hypothetical protein ACFFEF_18005 [Candidatus Thorarchaeota archaeon]
MKRSQSSKVIIVVVLCLLITVPTTLAANHSLVWSVNIDDEFTYALQRKTIDPSGISFVPVWMLFALNCSEGQKFTALVTEIDEIPSDIPVEDPIPSLEMTLTRNNDSFVLMTGTSVFGRPTGDWDFQTERLNLSQYEYISLIDDQSNWGVREEYSFTIGAATYSYFYELRYSKVTGTLDFSRFRISSFGSVLVDIVIAQWSEGMPTILPPDTDVTAIMLVAIVAAVFVIVAFLAYRWIKKPKGLAAQLGR